MEISQRYQITKKVTLVGALVNAFLASAQVVFGLIGQSQALLADGIHTLSDLSSDFVVLYASSRSSIAADENHPYGHGRIETLASLLLGLILVGVGISLGIRGINSIFTPDRPDPEVITIFFAGLAIVSKEALYRYTMKAARQVHSTLLESNAMHHRSDALSSIVVVIGIASQLAGIPHMDAAAAVIVGLMIALMGYKLTRKSLDELIDSSLDMTLVENIQQLIKADNNVKAIHSLRSRSLGGLGHVDAELRVEPRLTVSEAHYIAFSLEEKIRSEFPSIVDVSIHVDPLTETSHEEVTDLPARDELIAILREHWQGMPISDHISQINLHYLNRKIDADFVLPLALNTQENQAQIAQLIESAQSIKCIGLASIYFHQ